MSQAIMLALLPYLLTAGSALAVMLAIALHRNHLLAASLCIGGLGAAFLSLPVSVSFLPQQVTALLTIDEFAFFFLGLIFAATMAVALFAYGYLGKKTGVPEEFYLLLLLAALGAAVLAAASHFASLLLGLETLSVSLYALLAYLRTNEKGVEAGLKYLILAGFSSAFLLFGGALLYAEFGVLSFMGAAEEALRASGPTVVLLAGTVMIVTGIGFKLALVPFHLWTPDVYQGAPAPVTAFVATVSKGAVFALLLRYFSKTGLSPDSGLFTVLSIIALASMFIGNLLALLQDNIKRLLAYSSIAHLGYLLVAFLAGGPLAVTAVTFYLVAYFISLLGAFGTIILLSGTSDDAETITSYRHLAWRRPWLAGAFTAMLLSLAGIPLTAGFLGKFMVITAGVESSLWTLVVIVAITSVIGLYYYLRVIFAMFKRPLPGREEEASVSVPRAGKIVLAVLVFLLFWLGLYPEPLLALLRTLVIR